MRALADFQEQKRAAGDCVEQSVQIAGTADSFDRDDVDISLSLMVSYKEYLEEAAR